MNTIDILVIILIFCIVLKFISQSNVSANLFVDNDMSPNISCHLSKDKNDIKISCTSSPTKHINPIFLNQQYHNEYRDVLTSFDSIASSAKFNSANLPQKYSEPKQRSVSHLINFFLTQLNTSIQEGENSRTSETKWGDATPDPNVISGWEKVRMSLGLSPSLYKPPTPKRIVRVVSVDKIQRYEIDGEAETTIHLLLQKDFVSDQLLIKVSFIEKSNFSCDEDFFIKKSTRFNKKIYINGIFIVGVLSLYGQNDKQQAELLDDSMYNFDNLNEDQITDQRAVMKELEKKYVDRVSEMEHRVSMLDEEGKDFHKSLPQLYNYHAYRDIKNVFGDVDNKVW